MVSKRDDILERIVRLERELDRINQFPEHDPFPDGTVLRFDKRFSGMGRVYSYAAMRAEGDWHLTGAAKPRPAYSWAGLADFLTEGTVTNLEEACRWDAPMLWVPARMSTKRHRFRTGRDLTCTYPGCGLPQSHAIHIGGHL